MFTENKYVLSIALILISHGVNIDTKLVIFRFICRRTCKTWKLLNIEIIEATSIKINKQQ